MATNSGSSKKALADLMQASLAKNPALADKQRRLLTKLSSGSNEAPPADSTPSASADGMPRPQKPPGPQPAADDPNRPETEEDGLQAGAQRVARWRNQNAQLLGRSQEPPASSAQPGPTPASSPSQSDTPATTASRSPAKPNTPR